jgi:transporter family-2 protein
VNLLLYAFAAIAGAMNTIQAGANAQLRKSLDQPILAGLAVYVSGMLLLLILLPFVRTAPFDWSRVAQAPWWAWCGGILSIGSTMAGVLLARKLGSAAFTAATLTFSLICSVLLDHFGFVGFEVHRASPLRIIGCVLLISGLVLIARF